MAEALSVGATRLERGKRHHYPRRIEWTDVADFGRLWQTFGDLQNWNAQTDV
jgi:hypothetical protein